MLQKDDSAKKVLYKLNLPRSPMPMKASLTLKEGTYHQIWSSKEYQSKFSQGVPNYKHVTQILDGPPYANGDAHIGHAVNKILKDISARYEYVKHNQVHFQPGWDCYGLPIENAVEKTLKITSKDDNPASFTSHCKQYAKDCIQRQKKSFINLGLTSVWDKAYHTMDKEYSAQELLILADIVDNNYFYLDKKPVHWCYKCESSLAEAELEYQTISCTSLYAKFHVSNIETIFPEKRLASRSSVVIWTTTPWTLSENQAVAFSEDIEYAYLVSPDNQEGIFLSLRAAEFLSWTGKYNLLFYCSGIDLKDLHIFHPFTKLPTPFVKGDRIVDNELKDSTGFVHLAPAYGVDDFNVLKEHNIEPYVGIDGNGCYNSEHPYFPSKHIKDVDNDVIHLLQNNNAVAHFCTISHSQGHCWRHKTPVIFRCTEQCFLRLKDDNIIKTCKTYLDNIKFYPSNAFTTLKNTMFSRAEWCISRQRTWGVPMPIFVHKITGQIHPKTSEIFREVSRLISQHGIEYYYQIDLQDLIHKFTTESDNNSSYYRVLKYVTDVWFDSGCMPVITCPDNEKILNRRIGIEGKDQYRGWFQSCLWISALLKKESSPFSDIWSHGYVLDKDYKKMSKSVGNVVSIGDITKKFGTDVFRLWVASSDYTSEMSLSPESLNAASNRYRKIRNTLRFLLSLNPGQIKKEDYKKYEQILTILDKHVIREGYYQLNKILKYASQGQFHRSLEVIYNFCNVDISSVYIDAVRDRHYTNPPHSDTVQALQFTALHLLSIILTSIAPILPYTAQEVLHYIDPDLDILQYSSLISPLELDNNNADNESWTYIKSLKKTVGEYLPNIKPGVDPKKLALSIVLDETEHRKMVSLFSELNFILGCGSVQVHYLPLPRNAPIKISCKDMTQDAKQCPRCRNYKVYKRHICDLCIQQEQEWCNFA